MKTYLCMFDLPDHDGGQKTEVAAESARDAAESFANGGDFPPNGRLPVAVAEVDDDGNVRDWRTYTVTRRPHHAGRTDR